MIGNEHLQVVCLVYFGYEYGVVWRCGGGGDRWLMEGGLEEAVEVICSIYLMIF